MVVVVVITDMVEIMVVVVPLVPPTCMVGMLSSGFDRRS